MPADAIEVVGVVDSVAHGVFVVHVDLSGREYRVLARASGRLHVHRIRIVPGDRVRVELSPYDTTRGRIVRRLREGEE